MGQTSAINELMHALWVGGTLTALTDAELMKRFVNQRDHEGDVAFDTLLRRHGPTVFGICRGILRNEHEVEDAFQATFMVLVSKMRSIRGENLEPWLRRVARRVAVRAKGAIERRRFRERALVDLSAIAAKTGTSEGALALVLQEVNHLPDHLRNALILCDLEGMTTNQAAARLHRKAGTLRTELVRARRLLRERVSSRDLEPSTSAGCLTLPAAIHSLGPTVPSSLLAKTARLASLNAAQMESEAATSAALETLIRGTLRVMAVREMGAMLALLVAASIGGGLSLRALAGQAAVPPPPPVTKARQVPATEKPHLVRTLAFRPDPAAARNLLEGASPDSFRFVPSPERPSGIIKEPSYRATPRFGVFRVGTGPRSTYTLAVDEPVDGDWRIYVDVNRNGDLSDDGDGRYDTMIKDQCDPYRIADLTDMVWNDPEINEQVRSTLREKFLMLQISRGITDKEAADAPHGVSFRRVVYNRQPRWNHEVTDYLRITGTAAAVGHYPDPYTKQMQDGCLVLESVGLLHPQKLRPGMHFGAFETTRLKQTAQQAWFVKVRKNGEIADAPFPSTYATFKLNCSTGVMKYFGRQVEWTWPADGSRVDLADTDKERAPKFHVGRPAPPSTFELGESKRIKLSDLVGNVIVLAVCQLSESPSKLAILAHLDSTARATRESGVVVLAVSGLDARNNYEGFVARHRFDWSIPVAFDAASTVFLAYPDGFHTEPTPNAYIYILDRDGNLAARIVDFKAGDPELDASLKSLGVQFRIPSDYRELPSSVWAVAREDR